MADLLDERVAAPDVAVLATELMALPARPTAGRLFDLLDEAAPTIVRDRVPALLGELARRDDRWRRIVLKSMRSKGRCPRAIRAGLRGHVEHATAPRAHPAPLESASAEVPAAAASRLQVARGRIHLTTQASSVRGIPSLLQAISDVKAPRRLQLDLSGCDHVYLPALAILASWARSRSVSIELAGESPETSAYLDRCGFMDAVEGRPHVVGALDAGRRVALDPIEAGTHADVLASRIVRIVDDHGMVASSDRGSLLIVFAELIENVIRHATSGAGALVGAELYPRKSKLTVVVVDAGIGIRESFLRGRNPEAKVRIQRGEDPLRLAVLPLVTSKPVTPEFPVAHAGYGLFLASEIAVRNHGTFMLASDDRSLSMYQRHARRHAVSVRHARWKGTIVCLVMDLSNVVPLRDVYQTLPRPDGYSAEDFFS